MKALSHFKKFTIDHDMVLRAKAGPAELVFNVKRNTEDEELELEVTTFVNGEQTHHKSGTLPFDAGAMKKAWIYGPMIMGAMQSLEHKNEDTKEKAKLGDVEGFACAIEVTGPEGETKTHEFQIPADKDRMAWAVELFENIKHANALFESVKGKGD